MRLSETKKTKSVKSKKKKSKSSRIKKILVIVESPAKARTITRYLKSGYIVEACMGHIIDLPKSRMAVDIEQNFKPEYITVRGKAKILNRLKSLARSSNKVLIAADPDREGEAISWHLKRALSNYEQSVPIKRIEFNEISEDAIREVIFNEDRHRDINMDLVNAQQARRILDRLVGYNISPILWQKIKRGLSAGRVQSIALKKICKREQEIEAFRPQEYWRIEAELKFKRTKIVAELLKWDGVKTNIVNEKQSNDICQTLQKAEFIVSAITKKERKRQPSAPYNTSRLQQDASNRLGFASQKTMMIAQQLYEGVELASKNVSGLITYMRTDSTRVSEQTLASLKSYIVNNYGKKYLQSRVYRISKRAQDAHEAIRPVNVNYSPDDIHEFLTKDQFRLYQMIWQKFVSSQMASEVSEQHTLQIQADQGLLVARQSEIKFDGFTKVFTSAKKGASKINLPKLSQGEKLHLIKLDPTQHFTQPPPRFNDASLVKVLEESGVGRPSTYAPTIQTLIRRYYVKRLNKAFQPTEVGSIVNRVMEKHFEDLVDEKFTARMEESLDLIARGNPLELDKLSNQNEKQKSKKSNHKIDASLLWTNMLREFYEPFSHKVHRAAEEIEDMKAVLDKPTEFKCEKCGTNMVKRLGRNGYFLACPRFPECRNAKSIPLGECPVCKTGSIVQKSMRRRAGRHFYGCSCYPECEFVTWHIPTEKKCSKCQRLLFSHSTKERGHFTYCVHCEPQYVKSGKSGKSGKSKTAN